MIDTIMPQCPGDVAISLVDFANTFAAKTNSLDVPDIHPAAATSIAHWLDGMLTAAENERPAVVAQFARMVTAKVAQERQWQDEDRRPVAMFRIERFRNGKGW